MVFRAERACYQDAKKMGRLDEAVPRVGVEARRAAGRIVAD
jgi:hypothetical protein